MTAIPEVSPEDRLRLERAVRHYEQIGLAPHRAVKHLLREGFPIPQVRAKYPALPDDAFVVPAGTQTRHRRRRTHRAPFEHQAGRAV